MLRSSLVALAALGAVLWSVPSAHAQALGSEFQVNSYTTGYQRWQSLAAAGNGDFVVVWESGGSNGGDTSGYSVQGQRYASDGTARGGEFQVNTYTTGGQRFPSVGVDGVGDFVVVWHSGGSSVQGQRYASDGTARGGAFQVNTYTTDWQRYPSVGVDGVGDFVVVWESSGSDGGDTSGFSVQGQRYASDGARRGAQFQVNTFTTLNQSSPRIAVEPDGDFVVVWASTAFNGGDISGQRYASDGTPRGGEFTVNSDTTGSQRWPAVAMKLDGEFIVGWDSYASSVNDFDVHARRYAADGTPKGAQIQVNAYTTGRQTAPSVGLEADGDFVVSWGSLGSAGSDTSYYSAQARGFASDGTPRGAEFEVNVYTTGSQFAPKLAVGPSGRFVVAWGSRDQDGSGTGVFGRQFDGVLSTISLGDSSVTEGAALAMFTVTLSEAVTSDVTVDWTTALGGGATSGVDYVAASGSVTIPAGQVSGSFPVSIIDDSVDEDPEDFFVNLVNPVGASIGDGQGRCLISDDDPTPLLAFGGAAEPVTTEGDAGTTPQGFTVTLTGATASTVEVTFATGSAGTATSGSDYVAKTGSIRFTPGETSKVFRIRITGDTLDEARETFFVNLSRAVNATIGDTQSMGTIVDNDPTPGGSPNLTISDAVVAEGNSGTAPATFTVSLSAPAPSAVSFTYGTGGGGTATSGVDYVGFVLKTATIAAGQTSKNITVAVNGDAASEPNETYFVNVTSASNATIADGQGKGSITDDDAP